MLKLTRYIDPASNMVWCITMEFIDENNKPVFKAYYDAELIREFSSNEWCEQFRENQGMNVCHIYINESPDE